MWIYLDDSKTFRELDRNDPRFDWNNPHAPPGMVGFAPRKGGAWRYVHFGNTKQEAADSANRHALKELADLESRIERVRATLVRP